MKGEVEAVGFQELSSFTPSRAAEFYLYLVLSSYPKASLKKGFQSWQKLAERGEEVTRLEDF